MFKGFSHSVMGASHEKKGTVCQDSSAYFIGDGYAVAVVADGHGSKKHFRSHIGSKAAVEATLATLERFYMDSDKITESMPDYHDRIIRNIEKQIIAEWNVRVQQHAKEHYITPAERRPFSKEELEAIPTESFYGTTLIVAVSGYGYSFGFQIGDGSLVAVDTDGTARLLMDYNEANPANITASMCNANAASMFDHFYTEDKKIMALYVSTDGLYTSFGSEYDFLDYHTIITSQIVDSEKFESAVVKNMIKRSRFGTEDDISIAVVYDNNLVPRKLEALQAKIEENKRLAAERRRRLV